MSSTRLREVVSGLAQGFVFLIGAVGVALTVWLWGKRRSERSQQDINDHSRDSNH
jgi:CHASE3 domain sensor protein